MTNTVDFDHELLFERLPPQHVWRLCRAWEHRRQMEGWARQEKVSRAVLEAVDQLIAPCHAILN